MKSNSAGLIRVPAVFVIVLNYNGKEYLHDCLSSIVSQTYANCKVVLCDNASTDGSVDFVKRHFPSVTIIANVENLGFAEGNNVAMRFALNHGAEYVFLLNNDTVAGRDLVERLVKSVESGDSVGIVGPEIVDIKNANLVQEQGMTIDRFGFPVPMEQKESKGERVSEVFYVSGCAMLIKRQTLRTVGLFDERYFMFAEDLDLCWRAQLAGHRVLVDRYANLKHVGGGSIVGGPIRARSYVTDNRRIFLRERNTLRTLIKNYSGMNLAKILPVYAALLSTEGIAWACLLRFNICVSLLRGMVWNLRVLRDTLNRRQRVQGMRAIADQHLMRRMVRVCGKVQTLRLVGIPRVV